MAKQRVQSRVEPDTKEQIAEYQEERDIGETEAIRRLIKSGLANEGYPVDGATSHGPLEVLANVRTILGGTGLLALGAAVVVLGGLLASAGSVGPALATAALGTVTALLGTLLLGVAVIAQLALARPLAELVAGTEEAA